MPADDGPGVLGVVVEHGEVGYGHLSRGLAVAEAWVAHGGAARVYVAGTLPDLWSDRLTRVRAVLRPLDAVGEEAADSWLLDGYGFPVALQQRLHRLGALAVVDDHGIVGTYDADLVIDHNLGATNEAYADRTSDCQLLLGPTYALLRSDVAAALPVAPRDRRATPARVVVALGGHLDGPRRSAASSLVRRIEGLGLRVSLLEGVQDVGGLLAATDLAVTAAGTTAWELCAHGVPCVVLAVADNQQPNARRLAEHGAAIDAGDLGAGAVERALECVTRLLDHPEIRARIAAAAVELVDGRGAARVASALAARVER